MSSRITCTVEGGVADLRLARPDKLNALDIPMLEELIDVLEGLHADPGLRAVVLSGEGRGFCAGLDMSVFRTMQTSAGDSATAVPVWRPRGRVPGRGQTAVHLLLTMPAPVIAALHGAAVGAGLQLALGADLRLVAPDATLSVLEMRWGIAQDMLGTQILPRLVGLDVAKQLTWFHPTLSGTEAVEIGLATRVAEDPRAAAFELATELCSRNPDAVRSAKHLLNLSWFGSFYEGAEGEQRSLRTIVTSPNQVEASRAFLERRPPVFTT